ncbi:MAG TPA: alpha-ketoacid dehydrogenase subunit beta [Propionicimonas sp.]|jgi:2-oxoisovalerate dehydrogenase E1 component subunit beta|nr:alpha-ketoacid dehydrogenase subunit beta [Propionicimonas sp.]
MTTLTVAKALNAGLRRALAAEPKALLYGEDIGKLGGVFRVTEGLQAEFGPDRVVDSPLAESGLLGTAVGLAARGYRPVVEIQFDGFVYPAFDQLVSQVSRLRFRTAGRISLPLVLRIPYGGGIGAIEHHSESPEAYFAHTPGLKVVTCATPEDAYWMIQQAIADDDPVVFLEPKRRYHDKGEVDIEQQSASTSLYSARIVKPGSHATLIAYGPMVRTCVEAALVAADEGIDLEVIDLRSLSPLDEATIIASVKRTGRAVVVHEAVRTLGMGAEIAARIQEHCLYDLEAPVLRVTGYDLPYPPSRVEEGYLPDLDRILDAVDRSLNG